ncbi:MAG: proton-conducting transporter membrane subunit [Thermoanaerobaculia bacterium]
MTLWLILAPLIGALLAFVVPSERLRPSIVAVAAVAHTALTVGVIRSGSHGSLMVEWLRLDALGTLVLLVISTLFLVCAIYAVGYLRSRSDRPNRVFCTSLLLFLVTTTVLTMAQQLTVMWVAMEATTLSTALLLYFNQNERSLEATWKYLMIGSLGIAFALLGTLFIAYATFLGFGDSNLDYPLLVHRAAGLSVPWLRAGFVFLLVGYGTKLGLAPLHTWKPDAYGEAPGVVGALLAGGMTSAALLALLRVYRIVDASGDGVFARGLFVTLGLLSIATAVVMMVGQRDLKRLLAYSSVEHVGVIAVGIGLGGVGIFGALLHMVNYAMTKGVLFLSAGNIHRGYRSKRVGEVTGALIRLPVSAGLFLAGFFAITGSPPFGPFVSELTILNAATGQHRVAVAAIYVTLLVLVFVAMGASLMPMVEGAPPVDGEPPVLREKSLETAPLFVALALVLMMGIWIPAPLQKLLHDAAKLLGG